jgi:RES domain-containing protein
VPRGRLSRTDSLPAEPKLVQPPSRLYRIGRPPFPFRWRDPPDPLSGDANEPVFDGSGRWDDAAGEFSTLYAGTDKLTVFAETIAPFRAVPGLRERIHAETSEDEPDNPNEPPWENELGVVPPEYFNRALGVVELDDGSQFIDVDDTATHGVLNERLGELLQRLGVAVQYDRGVLMTQDRRVTRAIARFLYEGYAGEADGIRYESRVAPGLECWALWPTAERFLGPSDLEPLSPDNPVLIQAASLVHVALPDPEELEAREWVDRPA